MTLLNHALVALVAAGTCMLYILEWKITADIVFFCFGSAFRCPRTGSSTKGLQGA